MFTIDRSFTHVAAPSEQVLLVAKAINAVSVKVPGMPAEPATAHLVAWQPQPARARLVIYLHYASSKRAVAYVPTPPIFPVGELERVVEAAHEFLESMGFMMDDSGYASLPPAQRAALLAHTPAFHADLEAFAKSLEGDMEAEPELIADGDVEVVDEPEEVLQPLPVAIAGGMVTPEPHAPSPRAEALGRLLMSF